MSSPLPSIPESEDSTPFLLHVLGAAAVAPAPRDPCAGYLLDSGASRILLDCGPGTLGPLRAALSLADLDAILLSHAHPDHCLDLVMLRQVLAYDPQPPRRDPLDLWCGPAVAKTLEGLGACFNHRGGSFWAPYLNVRTFDPGRTLQVPGLELSFARTEHYIPCWAMRCRSTAAGGGAFVYGADTGPCDAVAELAAGADLLMLEATLPERAGYEEATGHLSAAEAGAIAARAGVGRLLLTHTFASLGRSALAAKAAAACPGIPVSVAEAGDRWRI